jgi:hypothetical protein
VGDLADARRFDAVETGDGSRRNVETAAGLPRFGNDFRIIEQRAGADHHEVLSRSENFPGQSGHDQTARRLDH